jgi:hypothetical protein
MTLHLFTWLRREPPSLFLPLLPADMRREHSPLSSHCSVGGVLMVRSDYKPECKQDDPQYSLAAIRICGFIVVLTS